jgi:taurine dioxygenase
VWRAGDILMWDNRCVMHRRDPFDAGARRIMHRVQCAGDMPQHRADGKRGHPRSQR